MVSEFVSGLVSGFARGMPPHTAQGTEGTGPHATPTRYPRAVSHQREHRWCARSAEVVMHGAGQRAPPGGRRLVNVRVGVGVGVRDRVRVRVGVRVRVRLRVRVRVRVRARRPLPRTARTGTPPRAPAHA